MGPEPISLSAAGETEPPPPQPPGAAPIRVLRVIARMNIGGPAYHVSLLSGRLDRTRYQTLLLTGSLGAGEGSFEQLADRYGAERRTVPGLRPELNPLSDLRALAALIRTMRAYRPDIVHTHTAKAGALGRLAAILAPGVKPVIVHTYHGHVLRGYFGRLTTFVFRTVERLLAAFSDCLVGVSDSTVEDLVQLGIAPKRKFRTVPIGLELEALLSVEPVHGVVFRQELGLADEHVLVTFVGRLAAIKRVDVLLRALAAVRAAHIPVVLVVVGDGELRSELERLASELGIGESVHFVGFRHDLPGIVAASDLAVLSSDNEGTPVALIEAAAGARAAVATDVGGVGEIVTVHTGKRVPPGDAEAFAAALADLAQDAEARMRMGAAAREHVRTRFSSERLLSDVDALYRELLCARRAGSTPPRRRRSKRPEPV